MRSHAQCLGQGWHTVVSCLRFILIGLLLHGTLQLWGDPEEGGALLSSEGGRE